ncbi:MAG: hypothetical protein ACP5E2_14305 [Terracidiphilus sp.]
MSLNAKQQKTNSDDMRPEYDFSKGVRGVHAHRFSKLSSDEALMLDYWRRKGFEARSFPKNEMRDMKTPDFRLSQAGREVALCEVKSFQRDTWLEEHMRDAGSGELVGGLRSDPIYNRISNAVHTAAKQFTSVNSDHKLLNFLVLVNHDTSAKYQDLVSVLTGYWDPLHGVYEQTHTQFSEGRIRNEKTQIDLYLWLNIHKDGTLSKESLFFGNPETRLSVCELIGINPMKIKDILPAA